MRALRGKIMKYGKRIAAALLAAALAVCLTGCGGTADWASAKPLIQRAREMNSTDKETSVLHHVGKSRELYFAIHIDYLLVCTF